MTDAQADRIAALLEALPRAIAAAIAGTQAPASGSGTKTLRLADRKALEILLPAIASRWAPRTVFYSAEVLDHVATMPLVTAALFGGAAVNANSARRLGKLLRRAADVEIGGFVIRRGAENSAGIFWCLERL